MRNMSTLDRIIRLVISLALFQLAYFWLAGGWQIVGTGRLPSVSSGWNSY